MGTLFVVATPIGNLKDITLRALEILKEVDLILSESPQTTKKILAYYNISKKIKKYSDYFKEKKLEDIVNDLSLGLNIALVSEAGTPLLQDPGILLVKKIYEFNKFNKNKIKITPIPGASSLTSLISVCPISLNRFFFLGFLPKKKKRKKIIKKIINFKYPVIFYESSHRIFKILSEIKSEILKENRLPSQYEIFIGREITKKFESFYYGTIDDISDKIKLIQKGEFSIILYYNKKINFRTKL